MTWAAVEEPGYIVNTMFPCCGSPVSLCSRLLVAEGGKKAAGAQVWASQGAQHSGLRQKILAGLLRRDLINCHSSIAVVSTMLTYYGNLTQGP